MPNQSKVPIQHDPSSFSDLSLRETWPQLKFIDLFKNEMKKK